MERAKPIVFQTFDVVVTAEELLLRQTCSRSHAQSGAVARTYVSLGGPNLLSTRSHVYVKAWTIKCFLRCCRFALRLQNHAPVGRRERGSAMLPARTGRGRRSHLMGNAAHGPIQQKNRAKHKPMNEILASTGATSAC